MLSPSLVRFAHSVPASSVVLRPTGEAGSASALSSFDVPSADVAAFGGESSRRPSSASCQSVEGL